MRSVEGPGTGSALAAVSLPRPAPVEHLRQNHEPRAFGVRPPDPPFGFAKIGFFVRSGQHLDRYGKKLHGSSPMTQEHKNIWKHKAQT